MQEWLLGVAAMVGAATVILTAFGKWGGRVKGWGLGWLVDHVTVHAAAKIAEDHGPLEDRVAFVEQQAKQLQVPVEQLQQEIANLTQQNAELRDQLATQQRERAETDLRMQSTLSRQEGTLEVLRQMLDPH